MLDLNREYSESGFFREVLFQPAMPSGKSASESYFIPSNFFHLFVPTGNSREDNELPVIYVTFMSSGGNFMDSGAIEK